MLNSRYLAVLLLLLLSLITNVSAQSADRTTQWDSYHLPTGNFVRFVDEEQGYWLWHPAEWQEKKDDKGNQFFSVSPQGPNLFIFIENIPEGYGLANYSSALLKQFRKVAVSQESFTNRPVSIDGIEAREFHFEREVAKDQIVHETIWFTTVGSHAYSFIYLIPFSEEEKFEPYFKRIVETFKIGAAGHWDKEFETLRTSFNSPPMAGSELTAATIAAEIREGKTPAPQWTAELTQLVTTAPVAALDLLTDSDSQVRGATIALLSKSNEAKIDDILLWALTDPDSYCSGMAAQVIAEHGEKALEILKKRIPSLIDKPGTILRASAAFNTQASREAIYDEAVKTGKLPDWAKEALFQLTLITNPSLAENSTLDSQSVAKLIDAPTTGATLFPKNSIHYLVAPNFQETLEKFDNALAGIQLDTVRDQMTLVLIIKTLKAQLAAKLKAGTNRDASAIVGINLKAPLALAAWPKDDKPENVSSQSAAVVRISDRSRFERLLAQYQEQFGSFDLFVSTSATMARIAAITPAIVPIVLAGIAANAENGPDEKREIKPLHKETYFQHQLIKGIPLTVIERVTVFESTPLQRNTIFILYLGDTAIVASSKAAIIDLLQAATKQTTIDKSEAFLPTMGQSGEVLFFSHLGELIKDASLNMATTTTKNPFIQGLVGLVGDEIGALQLNKSSCETLFHLDLSSQALASTIRPFKPADLHAPENLLPNNTIFYAGTVFDAEKLWNLLKSVIGTTNSKTKKKPQDSADREIEQNLLPYLQGEMAFALISIKPVLIETENKNGKLPAFIMALKLKDSSLASQFRNNKVFKELTRLSDVNVLNAPIAILPLDKLQFLLSVTNDYLVIADSTETLKLLEKTDKFAYTRDYIRSAKSVSDNLALFATYNIDSAFDEAAHLSANNPTTKQILNVMSALLHSFHSQHASIAINNNSLKGSLAVAFDREGRYSVGELAEQAHNFDVANAIISAKGINVIQSERMESLKLRVTTKPEITTRVQDDIKKFSWQQIEPNTKDGALILNTSARKISDSQSISLPVNGDEFKPYLRATTRINSNAPQIIDLAKQIVGDDHDSRSVARKLGEWTYHNLKWKKVESDTVETLTSREADCLEHSELYVALARASGLPARVVTGAALSGGSFGAHAWVEVYLGQWVEVDPTWGLMDYVDATHLRFDADTFISYAMLNQIELEVLEAHPFVAEFQRDPVQLIDTIIMEKSPVTGEIAFDLALTTERVLGADGLVKLTEKQRAAVVNSFERMVAKQLQDLRGSGQILKSEVTDKEASIFVHQYNRDKLLRFSLVMRNGAWYIVEIEITDLALPLLADTIKSAVEMRLPIISLTEKTESDALLNQIDKLMVGNTDQAILLLLKARILQNREISRMLANNGGNPPEKSDFRASQEILEQIIARWPNFAPAYHLLANQYFNQKDDLTPTIPLLQHYAQLMPVDPRPWTELGGTFEKLKRFDEAETAYQEAISRDHKNFQHYLTLTDLYIKLAKIEKAQESLTAALALAPTVDSIFYSLEEFLYDLSPEELQSMEAVLIKSPQEFRTSKPGLKLLAQVQNSQQKYEEALKTMEQALAFTGDIYDYIFIARLNRKLHRFTKVLEATEQAIKLDTENSDPHFERACALAQLGNKKEALIALKQALELDSDLDLDDADLKPLAKMPEFKSLLKNKADSN